MEKLYKFGLGARAALRAQMQKNRARVSESASEIVQMQDLLDLGPEILHVAYINFVL